MAVFGRDFTVGVFGEIGGVALFYIHGRAAVFVPAENIGLFLHRGAVPKLDKVADEADGLIAAVFFSSSRFVQAVGGNACPQDLIGDFGIFDFGIAGRRGNLKDCARQWRLVQL